MTVLSDVTLKKLIGQNELVQQANPVRAEHCAYEFTAGKLFFGGGAGASVTSIDFTEDGNQNAKINPGALVWVRSRESVSMPSDKVGIWIQTNTLSREGLLLLNMSLVEPGYQGMLTAAFVNFGKAPILITAQTKIAKLIFLCLDRDAQSLLGRREPIEYDAQTARVAMAAPSSFIRVDEMLPDLKRAEVETVQRMREELRRTTAEDTGKIIRQAWVGFGVGLLSTAVVITYLYFNILPSLATQLNDWDGRADASVRQALDGRLRDEMERAERTQQKIEKLQEKIERLEAKADGPLSPGGGAEGQ